MVFFFPLAHVNGWRNASKGGCLRSKLDSSLSFMPPSGLFCSLVSVAALVVLSPSTTFKPTVTTFVSAATCFFLDYFSSVPVLVDSSRILNLWSLLSTLQSKEWPWKLPILASGSSKDHWILYLLWSLDLRQSHLGGMQYEFGCSNEIWLWKLILINGWLWIGQIQSVNLSDVSFFFFKTEVLVLVAQSCLTPCNPWLLCPWNSPGKNTGVGCHSLLQGIFPNQGSNPRSPELQTDSLCFNHQGSPKVMSKSKYMIKYLTECPTYVNELLYYLCSDPIVFHISFCHKLGIQAFLIWTVF